MIVQALNGFWDWVYGIIAQIPIVNVVVPDLGGVVADLGVMAGVLLPLDHFKAALIAGVLFYGATISVIPVRWLIVLVRGVRPG